jgi:hypothetical protein
MKQKLMKKDYEKTEGRQGRSRPNSNFVKKKHTIPRNKDQVYNNQSVIITTGTAMTFKLWIE